MGHRREGQHILHLESVAPGAFQESTAVSGRISPSSTSAVAIGS